MYILDSFLNPDFIGFEFKSEAHIDVARKTILCNSKINSKDKLIDGAKIIDSIPESEINEVTPEILINKYNFCYY